MLLLVLLLELMLVVLLLQLILEMRRRLVQLGMVKPVQLVLITAAGIAGAVNAGVTAVSLWCYCWACCLDSLSSFHPFPFLLLLLSILRPLLL